MELHKPKNLYELLTLNMEQRFANRVAFRWYDADQDVVVEKHFGEYAQDIRRAVNYYLSTIPDIQGKRVCVWSNNSYHYAVNCYGVMLAGGVSEGKILMLEPRRVAARHIASRMSDILEENVGGTVGYRVRFENRVSSDTQIEVLTEGILTRMVVSDPTLDGVGIVVFDEFHERSINSDLALALVRQVQSVLRPDLKIVVMSATIDAEKICDVLWN